MLETVLQSFSFIPHTASEELIFEYFFSRIFPVGCQGNLLVAKKPIKLRGYNKKVCLVEDPSRNISVKVLSKYPQFHFFPLIKNYRCRL